MDEIKWYHDCKQGQGNFLQFPLEIQCFDGRTRKVHAVGTSGCRTCVCIYVRLNDTSCFIAHIAGELGEGDKDEIWQPNEDQGKMLRQAVFDKLKSYPQLTAFVNAKDYKLQEGDIALCSMFPVTLVGKSSVAKYLIQGLQDFFGDGVKAKWRVGFIVDHAAREIHWFDQKYKEEFDQEAVEEAKLEDTEEATPRDHGWVCQNDEEDRWKGRLEWHFMWDQGRWVTNWAGWAPLEF